MSPTPEMRYFSTRGGEETLSFEEAVMTGLAPNGGLYIPTHIPSLPADWQTSWASLPFHELSHRILSLFVPESVIPPADLQDIITRSYATFRHEQVTPVRQTAENEYVLELWHGPTWAFKDVALQFLGNLFAYFLARRNEAGAEPREGLTVVGATSGDTGSAAIYGLRSKPDISIFILYPDGRVSPIQLAQMATVPDANVHVVAVEDSDFDTCQAIVKTLFSDSAFNATHRLGAINSINWARILAQIVYYFSAYFQLPAAAREAGVQFVVPTGNFGDILAGWYAKKLGLPMRELVVATNENDILERFFRTGRYAAEDAEAVVAAEQGGSAETQAVGGSSDGQQATQAHGVKATHSPAMDILLSSNFERLLYHLALETTASEGSGAMRAGEGAPSAQDRKRAQETLNGWMAAMKRDGKVDLGEEVRKAGARDFWAERVSDEQTVAEIKKYYAREEFGSYVVDPHTAVGLATQERAKSKAPDSTWVTLSTAHPAKFSSAVELALSSHDASFNFDRDVLPDELRALAGMQKRIHKVRGEAGVRELIERVKGGQAAAAAGGEGKGSI